MIKAWLTYSSLMVSRTAVRTKNEKSVRGRAAQPVTVRDCVCCAQRLPDPAWEDRESDRQTEREAVKRGGGAAVEKSEVVRPFPVARETNASFKEKNTANDKHRQLCSDRITWLLKTPLPLYAQKPEIEKNKTGKEEKDEGHFTSKFLEKLNRIISSSLHYMKEVFIFTHNPQLSGCSDGETGGAALSPAGTLKHNLTPFTCCCFIHVANLFESFS